MTKLTITTVCPLCDHNVFSFSQISDAERQWYVRLLCENAACNFNTPFTITMTTRVFEIFKMEFKPAMDELSDPSYSVSAGYHDVTLFMLYFTGLLGRVSANYLIEQIQIRETDLPSYFMLLSADDLVAFDGNSVEISEGGRALVQNFLSQKKHARSSGRQKDFDHVQQTLMQMLLDGAIDHFNAERSKIDNVMIDLSHADLSGKKIAHANFRKTSLTRASFEDAVLDHCNFTGAAIDHSNLKKASLRDCPMQGADLKSSDLSAAIFERCVLTESDLSLANAFRATFRGCNLRAANFSKVNLRAVTCRGSDFSLSRFRQADMTGVALEESLFNEADFEDCDLNKVRFDAETKFLGAQNILLAHNISRPLWQKFHYQNRRLPDFAEYQALQEPKKTT
jgi:uncharacterized protein YjbI with pentapeptide repeats